MSFNISEITASDIGIGNNQPVQDTNEVVNVLSGGGTFSIEDLINSRQTVSQQTPAPVEQSTAGDQPPAIPAQDSTFSIEEIANQAEQSPEQTPSTGRPSVSKDIMVEYMKENIEKGRFYTFSDYDDKQSLEDYLGKMSNKDLQELLDMNVNKQQNLGYEEAPQKLRQSLPPKLQYAVDYLEQGGNLDEILPAIAYSVDISKLDPHNEVHIPQIVRSYLQSTTAMTPALIDEQIKEWSDNGLMEKKAETFKPLLDNITEQNIQREIAQRAEYNRQQELMAQQFMDNMGKTLSRYEIGGMKVPRKDVTDLFYDIVEPRYVDRYNNPTNIIGYQLERIQNIEPDYDFLAEIAWHLKDREGFKNAMKQQGANNQVQQVVRELKDSRYTRSQMTETEPQPSEVKKFNKPRNVLSR